jgi:putative peptidoglycan lipid II flippase
LLPAIFAAGIYQINILVDTIFASFLPAGSPTWLYLSERIIQLPLGMFGVAVAVVSLPNISEFFQKKNYDALRANIFQGFSAVILVGFASLVGLFLLSELIVFLLFERGQFTSFDTIQTSKSLLAYAFGLPFLMSNKFFNTIYFAMSKTSMVLKLGLVSLFINILLNYFFVYVLELNHVGIALATSFSAIAIYLISLFWLNKNDLFNGRGKILSYIFALLGLLIMIFTINI